MAWISGAYGLGVGQKTRQTKKKEKKAKTKKVEPKKKFKGWRNWGNTNPVKKPLCLCCEAWTHLPAVFSFEEASCDLECSQDLWEGWAQDTRAASPVLWALYFKHEVSASPQSVVPVVQNQKRLCFHLSQQFRESRAALLLWRPRARKVCTQTHYRPSYCAYMAKHSS